MHIRMYIMKKQYKVKTDGVNIYAMKDGAVLELEMHEALELAQDLIETFMVNDKNYVHELESKFRI
jgi:hypothetical protein